MKRESNKLKPTKVKHYKFIKSLAVEKENNNEEIKTKLTYPSQ